MMEKRVLVFGANGNLGRQFVQQALEKGHRIRAFVRSPEKFSLASNEKVETFKGNATNRNDVENALSGVDVVVSCLGNPNKNVLIMEDAHRNIMEAAGKQTSPPRCLLISSIGVGGSSWLVKFLLQRIGGKEQFENFERAERAIMKSKNVPYVIVRPSGLTNKEGKGTYRVIQKPTIFFPKFMARADVARFYVDCLEDTSYDGKAVMIQGA